MKNIIFIAPPAAGKGTISKQLEEKYNMSHISTGDLLRNNRDRDDEIGRHIVEHQDKGLLVDDEITMKVLEERVKEPDCENGYILDGFPRTVKQAELYDKLLEGLGYGLGIVIYLDIPKKELMERIVGRSTCSVCGEIHNDYFEPMKPFVENVCNKCGGELTRRSDDNEESFNQRYDTYIEKTQPLIDYYEEKGILKRVSSLSSKENLESIIKILEENNG